MPYSSNADLPSSVKSALPESAGQNLFCEQYNFHETLGKSKEIAFASAWLAVQKAGYKQDEKTGIWALAEKADAAGHVPPQAVQENARQALSVRQEKPVSQRGMTAVGIARARDLSNGKALSIETVRRMKAYFDRHQKDKEGETWSEKGKGWQAWMGWGGDEGRAWANKIVSSVEKHVADYGSSDNFSVRADIVKANNEQQIVYGWASIVEKDGEPVVDTEGDVIDIADLEEAALAYVMKSRVASINHTGDQVGSLVESIVFTKEKQQSLGVNLGKVGWWVGYKISDAEIWERVKSGELRSFSIGGSAVRTEI